MDIQIIPKASIISADSKNNSVNNGSTITKYVLNEFTVDQSSSKVNSTKLGSKNILVREDLIPDLNSIKSILNSYGIPFSCNFINININNPDISHMAKLGLEINLNIDSGLTFKSDLKNDDYYIGPDYNRPYGNWYRLKVYGYIKTKANMTKNIYKPIHGPLEVYDIRNTYAKKEPEVKTIFKPLLDITKVFEDHGFKQPPPTKEFYYKSDNLNSNWFVFYKPSKINIGDTYIENLSKVYDNKGEPVWQDKNLLWNGERFIWKNS